MHVTTAKTAFRIGLIDALPFILVVVPFALLFGVLAADAQLSLAQTFGFSFTVFAGASQFAAVQLITDAAPLGIVVATALAVNLRNAMYSAALTPWLGNGTRLQRACIAYVLVDQNYALAVQRFERDPDWSPPVRRAYYFGTIALIYPLWLIATMAGAVVGTTIPAWLALDFALPICFLALIGPMLRSPAHLAAAATSIALALALSGLPYGTGLLLAAAAAMAVGARVELWQERRVRAAA